MPPPVDRPITRPGGGLAGIAVPFGLVGAQVGACVTGALVSPGLDGASVGAVVTAEPGLAAGVGGVVAAAAAFVGHIPSPPYWLPSTSVQKTTVLAVKHPTGLFGLLRSSHQRHPKIRVQGPLTCNVVPLQVATGINMSLVHWLSFWAYVPATIVASRCKRAARTICVVIFVPLRLANHDPVHLTTSWRRDEGRPPSG